VINGRKYGITSIIIFVHCRFPSLPRLSKNAHTMAEEEVINPPAEEAPIANDAEVRKREWW